MVEKARAKGFPAFASNEYVLRRAKRSEAMICRRQSREGEKPILNDAGCR